MRVPTCRKCGRPIYDINPWLCPHCSAPLSEPYDWQDALASQPKPKTSPAASKAVQSPVTDIVFSPEYGLPYGATQEYAERKKREANERAQREAAERAKREAAAKAQREREAAEKAAQLARQRQKPPEPTGNPLVDEFMRLYQLYHALPDTKESTDIWHRMVRLFRQIKNDNIAWNIYIDAKKAAGRARREAMPKAQREALEREEREAAARAQREAAAKAQQEREAAERKKREEAMQPEKPAKSKKDSQREADLERKNHIKDIIMGIAQQADYWHDRYMGEDSDGELEEAYNQKYKYYAEQNLNLLAEYFDFDYDKVIPYQFCENSRAKGAMKFLAEN
jgi:hypothetical protein